MCELTYMNNMKHHFVSNIPAGLSIRSLCQLMESLLEDSAQKQPLLFWSKNVSIVQPQRLDPKHEP